uniref:Uncharacterized protein n=1 Tax=Trichobilharzia regenti TaxID=157069 RepID=A0AA85J2Q2_TRIRE|nr:unnamed protein product [Trichobilharzia regenti]
MKITYLICIVSLVVFRNVAAEAEETLTSENATETTTILDNAAVAVEETLTSEDAVAVEETLTIKDVENLRNSILTYVEQFLAQFGRVFAVEAEETLTSENATETTTILDDTVHSIQENFGRNLRSFFWKRIAAPVLSSLGLNQTFTVAI